MKLWIHWPENFRMPPKKIRICSPCHCTCENIRYVFTRAYGTRKNNSLLFSLVQIRRTVNYYFFLFALSLSLSLSRHIPTFFFNFKRNKMWLVEKKKFKGTVQKRPLHTGGGTPPRALWPPHAKEYWCCVSKPIFAPGLFSALRLFRTSVFYSGPGFPGFSPVFAKWTFRFWKLTEIFSSSGLENELSLGFFS